MAFRSWLEIGRSELPRSTWPSSERPASIASEPCSSVKSRFAGSRNRALPKIGFEFGKTEKAPVLVIGFVPLFEYRLNWAWLPKAMFVVRIAAVDAVSKMLSIARKYTCDRRFTPLSACTLDVDGHRVVIERVVQEHRLGRARAGGVVHGHRHDADAHRHVGDRVVLEQVQRRLTAKRAADRRDCRPAGPGR